MLYSNTFSNNSKLFFNGNCDIIALVILMSMDGRFIDKLATELNTTLTNGRINKIYQLSKSDFLLLVRAQKNESLYLSLSPQLARLHLTHYTYDKPQTPSGFCMLLRKYLENGIIRKIDTVEYDRIIKIVVQNANDFGEKKTYNIFIELMGKHANMAITDEDNLIIDAYKHVSPFDGQQRTFLKGFTYEYPQDQKLIPTDYNAIQSFFETTPDLSPRVMVDRIRGISQRLTSYLFNQAFNQEIPMIDLYQKALNQPVNPCVNLSDKKQFYWFNVFDTPVKTYESLSELLDEYFYETGVLDRTKQLSKNIYQLIKRELDKNSSKLEKLTQERQSAANSEILRMKGDLIVEHQSELTKGISDFEAYSYEVNQTISIQLDRLATPIENAQAYYKRYKKIKASISHLTLQIERTKNEIDYFETLLQQIEMASLNDLLEMIEELKQNHYLHEKPTKTKMNRPQYDTYYTSDKTEILVGKNNLQNEYITHQLAKHNETWFHVKNQPGSHVLVRKIDALTEEDIRSAAQLASYFSSARHSSSVPVDYTLIRYVKKVPGMKGSFVTYTHQKTIYIDPDDDITRKILKKRD